MRLPQEIEELNFLLYAGTGCGFQLGVHERLQDERGGYLVHYAAMLLAGVSGFVKNLVGLAGGQPLVPEVNGQAGQRAQFGGKGLGFGGLRANVAGEMQGIAHHDARDTEAAAEASQRAEIVAAVVLALQRQNRLRGQAQFVRDSYADAAGADVEAEIANSFQIFAPASSLSVISDP